MLGVTAPVFIASSRLVCFLAVIGLSSCPAAASSPMHKDRQATGSFELVVKDAQPLRPGTSKIRSRNALASRVHGLVPGNADGIQIVFLTRPITDAAGDRATFVLFLDRDDNVWQVNLSYVVPGTTVARTVAWKPDELRKYFSRVAVRGGRVALKSKGTYAETQSGHEALTLSWDVDVDLPVGREVTR